jgi:2-C-methyl-D-erythritol 4-phosphate cytidylyltransferase / 2-C-methyl-D-erythritol 2,4-cyclodiphosphate synthase
MKAAAIIVAAGAAARMGDDIPKQYKSLAGRPVLSWSIRSLAVAGIEPIVVVANMEHAALLAGATAGGPSTLTAEGGSTRTASVRAGLAALADSAPDFVLVHDAARPGLRPQMIRALLEELERGADAAAPALRLSDALRRVDGAMGVTAEVARDDAVMRVQTPQAFRAAALRAAFEQAPANAVFEDDLAAVRAAGFKARLIPGDRRLMKLTYPEDFDLAEQIFSSALTACVGSGFDAHRFGPGDHVTLCGVRIPHEKGLVGHSDADAGWHALVDAILGALGEGDIGAHFPPSDPQWKGANSEVFLRRAAQLADAAGARIAHVDVTLLCERPKIGPHREAMRARTAEVLALAIERVSVKATTTERLGFLGREEGLAAQATATVQRLL